MEMFHRGSARITPKGRIFSRRRLEISHAILASVKYYNSWNKITLGADHWSTGQNYLLYTDQNCEVIKLLCWLHQMRCTAVLVSGEELAVELVVCARFYFEVERQAAFISQTLHRAVQSVENSLGRDRRNVEKDARVSDEVGVSGLGLSAANVLLRGRISKHQEHEECH